MVRKQVIWDNEKIKVFNEFCAALNEGDILYNIDASNLWGEYLLVANIASISVFNKPSFAVLLLGVKKVEQEYVPYNLRISLTPDCAGNVAFLKYIGHCSFKLLPEMNNINISTGLVAIYSNVSLKKYTEQNLTIRKAKKRKYAMDGKLVLRKLNND